MGTKIFLVIFVLGIITASKAFTLERLGEHFDQKFRNNGEFARAMEGLLRTMVDGVVDMFHSIHGNGSTTAYGK